MPVTLQFAVGGRALLTHPGRINAVGCMCQFPIESGSLNGLDDHDGVVPQHPVPSGHFECAATHVVIRILPQHLTEFAYSTHLQQMVKAHSIMGVRRTASVPKTAVLRYACHEDKRPVVSNFLPAASRAPRPSGSCGVALSPPRFPPRATTKEELACIVRE